MLIVFGDNLHNMPNPIFGKNKKKQIIFFMSADCINILMFEHDWAIKYVDLFKVNE